MYSTTALLFVPGLLPFSLPNSTRSDQLTYKKPRFIKILFVMKMIIQIMYAWIFGYTQLNGRILWVFIVWNLQENLLSILEKLYDDGAIHMCTFLKKKRVKLLKRLDLRHKLCGYLSLCIAQKDYFSP